MNNHFLIILTTILIMFLIHKYRFGLEPNDYTTHILVFCIKSIIILLFTILFYYLLDTKTIDRVRVVKAYDIYSIDTSHNTFVLGTRKSTPKNDNDNDNDNSSKYYFYKKIKGGSLYLTELDCNYTFVKQSPDDKAHLYIAYYVIVSRFGLFKPPTDRISYYIIYMPKKYEIR